MTEFTDLPLNIQLLITQYLSINDLSHFALASKQCRSIADRPEYWGKAFTLYFDNMEKGILYKESFKRTLNYKFSKLSSREKLLLGCILEGDLHHFKAHKVQVSDFCRQNHPFTSLLDLASKSNNQNLLDHSYTCAKSYFSNPERTQDEMGRTLLHWALLCRQPLSEIAQLFQDSQTNINAQLQNGKTALYLAAQKGRLDAISLFLKNANVQINTADLVGQTPLFIAAKNGFTNIVICLMHHGANKLAVSRYNSHLFEDLEEFDHHELLTQFDTLLDTVLNQGVNHLNLPSFEQWLALHSDKSFIENMKQWIHYLFKCFFEHSFNQFFISHLCLRFEQQFEVWRLNEFENWKLSYLELNSNHGILGETSLLMQARDTYFRIFQPFYEETYLQPILSLFQNYLYSKLFPRALTSVPESTVLFIAAEAGQFPVVEALLADPVSMDFLNRKNSAGETALYIAAAKGYLNIVQLLLLKKAASYMTNHYGITALHIAILNGHDEVADCLLNANPALVHQPITSPSVPLYFIFQNFTVNLNQYFLPGKERISLPLMKQGTTALHIAAHKGNIKLAKRLKLFGADIKVVDADGKTAADFAKAQGFSDIVDLLTDKTHSSSTGPSAPTFFQSAPQPQTMDSVQPNPQCLSTILI